MSQKEFEPPKYVASLIAAINDGAKAAQTGALGFAAVGLYLVVTALSTTDEDLFFDRATVISQIGVQVPVVGAFYVAPWVFLALHVFTLNRYEMLAANLAQFNAELAARLPREADRERCRHLLANVEYVQQLAAPPGSKLHSRLWAWVFAALMVVLPIFAILLIQISALRYQSELGNWTDRAALAIDLFVLWRFFARRQEFEGGPRALPVRSDVGSMVASRRLWLEGLLLVSRAWRYPFVPSVAAPLVLIFLLNFAWINVIQIEQENIDQNTHDVLQGAFSYTYHKRAYIIKLFEQPLDRIPCKNIGLAPAGYVGFGCRYLNITGKFIVAKTWNDKGVEILKNTFRLHEDADDPSPPDTDEQHFRRAEAFSAIEPINLANRNLRSAQLEGASLFMAIFDGADLRGADLGHALLPRATLSRAKLQYANLAGAALQHTHFENAHLEFAHLDSAQLSGAILTFANLEGALLESANLQGADLRSTELAGTSMSDSNLQGAKLPCSMQGVNLKGANLERVPLGVKIDTLTDDLNCRYLRKSKGISSINFMGAVLADTTFGKVATADDVYPLAAIGPTDLRNSDLYQRAMASMKERQEDPRAPANNRPPPLISYGPLLVSSQGLQSSEDYGSWKTYNEDEFANSRAEVLADIAKRTPAAARAIAMIAEFPDHYAMGLPLSCRLLANVDAGSISLPDAIVVKLRDSIAGRQCPPPPPPATPGP